MFDVCVVGLGHIGLPTAALLARAGMRVAGVDISPPVLAALRHGEALIPEPGLTALVAGVVRDGSLVACEAVQPASTFLITVPTPVREDHSCDLTSVIGAAEAVAGAVTAGALVILESTVPPGTTAGAFAEVFERRGLVPGVNVHIAFCPERALPGNTLQEIAANARLVGGVTPACTEAATAFYAKFAGGRLHPTTATMAETAKLFENTYRDVNIALANQFAALCNAIGIPARETIALANHHPRVQVHNPGIGVGGHCIPVDPYFLQGSEGLASLVAEARAVNNAVPVAVARDIRAEATRLGARRVAILGLTYKEDTEDIRDSPAVTVARTLACCPELDIATFDPYVALDDLNPADSLAAAVCGADLTVVLVAHAAFIAGLPELLDARASVVDYTGKAPLESAILPLGRLPS